MISLLKLSRVVQGTLLSCGRVTSALSFPLTFSKGRRAPLKSCSTIKQSTDEKMSKQDATSKGSDSQQRKKKKTFMLSGEAQRAVWAWKIVSTIRLADPPKEFKDSLVNRLLQVTINKDKYEFTLQDKFKNQILQMFTVGIEIDPIIYKQERIQLARTIDSETKVKKLIFYPTTIVSKLVFNTILQQNHIFLFGQFGIGKSISIVLFMELAKNINRLVFLSKSQWIPNEKRKKYAVELNMLKKAGLVVIPPKCWYWSIDRNLQDDQKSMVELIKAQTIEFCLQRKYKEQLKSTNNLIDLIYYVKGLMPNQVKPIVVYDQINSLISYFRKWNYIIDDFNKNAEAFQQNIYDQKSLDIFIPSQKAQSLVTQLKRIGTAYILNSSYEVERQLLYPPKENSTSKSLDRVHLKLIDNGDPNTAQISYGTKLEKEGAKIEYGQLFLVLLRQKCRQIGALEQNIQKIVQQFNQNTIQAKFYYRFLFIREFFYQKQGYDETQYENIKELNSQNFLQLLKIRLNKQLINAFLNKLKDLFNKFCLARCEIQLDRYIGRPSNEKQKAIRRLVIHCIRKIAKKIKAKTSNQTKNALSFNTQDLTNDVRAYIINNFDIMSSFFKLEGRKNETLLPFKYSNKVMQLDWPVQDFLEISRKYDTFEITQQTLNFLGIDSTLADFWMNCRVALGLLFEYSLIKLMQHSTQVKFKECLLSGTGDDKIIQKVQFQSFEMPDSEVYFLAFNKNHTNNIEGVSLHKILEIILKKSKEKPNCCFKGIPYKKIKGTEQLKFAHNSKSIDFMFVKYHNDKDFYEINTFDVTIAEEKIAEKIKKARQLLKTLLDFEQKPEQTKFKITHHIVCPEQYCENSQTISEYIEIKSLGIESITFADCGKGIKELFETVRHLVIYSGKK